MPGACIDRACWTGLAGRRAASVVPRLAKQEQRDGKVDCEGVRDGRFQAAFELAQQSTALLRVLAACLLLVALPFHPDVSRCVDM